MSTTTLRSLTPRQRSVWRWIRDYHATHRHGCCLAELCSRFGIKSKNGGRRHVDALISSGWVEWPRPKSGTYRMSHCIMPSRESLEVSDAEAT